MNLLSAAVAEIDLAALRCNLQWIRSRIAPNTKILAVVKANAYGHGAIPISQSLEEMGVDHFGVALVEEGVTLRQAGVRLPILVMGGIFEDQVPEILQYRLTPVIYRISLARVLSEHAQNRGISWPVHIKVDTGMGRLGLRPEEVEGFVMGLRLLKGLEIEGILTHFADADISDKRFAQEQMAIFLRICDALDKNGSHARIRHVANSAAVVDLPETHLDMVRTGLMLYGYHPNRTDLPLQKILSWKTRVVHLKKVPTGTTISYGRTFVTRRESLIATLPVGYADGFDRTLTNRGVVLIRGMRVPVVGRVCMDMTMLDVTEVPGVAVGDTVTLLGRDGSEEITAHDLANQAGTICYEILSRIGPRVQRTYQ